MLLFKETLFEEDGDIKGDVGIDLPGEEKKSGAKKWIALGLGVPAALFIGYNAYMAIKGNDATPGKYPVATVEDPRPVDDGSIVSSSSTESIDDVGTSLTGSDGLKPYLDGLAKMEGDRIIPDDIDSKYPNSLEGTTLAIIEAVNDRDFRELSKYSLNPQKISDSMNGLAFKGYVFKGSQESDTNQMDKIGGKKLYGKNFTKKAVVALDTNFGSGEVTINMFYIYSVEDDSWFLTSATL